MSPTMTEGGVASWKKREGDSFAAGDVLLEIETDKAVINVEAQEDEIMGKILVQDGQKNLPVGKVIALLAGEGGDIPNIEIPKDEPTSLNANRNSQGNTLHRTHALLSRLARLHQVCSFQDPEKIEGIQPNGHIQADPTQVRVRGSQSAGAKVEKPMVGLAICQLIVRSMYQTAAKARAASVPPILAEFDTIIADYLPPSTPRPRMSIRQSHADCLSRARAKVGIDSPLRYIVVSIGLALAHPPSILRSPL
ncbi:single hybrid motif-containing protein [Lactifluus subvellereus]|nr:single hybrid motif-containing protein [Lactifluus subvellereus]